MLPSLLLFVFLQTSTALILPLDPSITLSGPINASEARYETYCATDARQPRLPLRDCTAAYLRLLSIPLPDVGRTWTLDRQGRRDLVAQRWTEGRCTIALEAAFPDTKDVFAPRLVWNAAQQIMLKCVSSGPRSGGASGWLGPKKQFEVGIGWKEGFS